MLFQVARVTVALHSRPPQSHRTVKATYAAQPFQPPPLNASMLSTTQLSPQHTMVRFHEIYFDIQKSLVKLVIITAQGAAKL